MERPLQLPLYYYIHTGCLRTGLKRQTDDIGIAETRTEADWNGKQAAC